MIVLELILTLLGLVYLVNTVSDIAQGKYVTFDCILEHQVLCYCQWDWDMLSVDDRRRFPGADQFHLFQTKDKRMLDKIAVIVFSPSLGIAEVILDSQILEKFAQLFILGYSATWDVFMF